MVAAHGHAARGASGSAAWAPGCRLSVADNQRRGVSGYWPASTAAVHINADIADAVLRYIGATGDEKFAEQAGLELLVATARMWRSLGHHVPGQDFRIDGVTGPDEYSALADNNVYTNLMAQRNLLAAADYAARFKERAATLRLIRRNPNRGARPPRR